MVYNTHDHACILRRRSGHAGGRWRGARSLQCVAEDAERKSKSCRKACGGSHARRPARFNPTSPRPPPAASARRQQRRPSSRCRCRTACCSAPPSLSVEPVAEGGADGLDDAVERVAQEGRARGGHLRRRLPVLDQVDGDSQEILVGISGLRWVADGQNKDRGWIEASTAANKSSWAPRRDCSRQQAVGASGGRGTHCPPAHQPLA